MASWRPPGSILEAPGLHFGGSGPHFRRLWTFIWNHERQERPKTCQNKELHHKVARPPKGGWAAVTPPGGFNPPATEGVPTACQMQVQLALSNHSWPISTFFRTIRSEVFFPLSFPFPRSVGTTTNPRPKSGKVCFFRIFSRFFRLPNRA